MKTRFKLAGVAALLGLAGIGCEVAAADDKADSIPLETKPIPPREAGEESSRPLDHPTELQDLIRYFREQRAEFLLARQQLRQQLLAAETEEQRRAILQQFLEQNRQRLRDQSDLRRDLRRRQMEIRRNRRHAPPES